MKNMVKVIGIVTHWVNGKIIKVEKNEISNALLNNLSSQMSTSTDRAINDLFVVSEDTPKGSAPATTFNITTPTSGGDASNPATGNIQPTGDVIADEDVRVFIENGTPTKSNIIEISSIDVIGDIRTKIAAGINETSGGEGTADRWTATAGSGGVAIAANVNGVTWNGYDIVIRKVPDSIAKDGIVYFDTTTGLYYTMVTTTLTPVNTFARKWRGVVTLSTDRSINEVALGHSLQIGASPFQWMYASQAFTALVLPQNAEYWVDWEIFLQKTV